MNKMCSVVFLTVFSLIFVGTISGLDELETTPAIGVASTACYDKFNRPQKCIPTFENAAYDVLMEATNTCGENGEMEFCVQTGVSEVRKSCEMCYPNQHSAKYLTDLHRNDRPTWWQSETMFQGIQYPNQVNLTLKFGKAFDITYIRLWFYSPRPESFYISKKTTEDGPWIPYQYYSATCRDTYGVPEQTWASRGEETRALCRSDYSDISPLRGGNIAFGTIEGRPSAYQFDNSPELQEWVTATEIMITLDRMNTFGDEIFSDPQVLRSYFYAIADVAVGARCKCNGHASECVASTGVDGSRRRVCKCEHNTAGPDCNICLPFYNDAPWARATIQNANECKQCNCNGYSNRCFFDEQLYKQTGHGGHCLDCTANRDGPNCERCRENYYMREDGYCVACECNQVGSRSLQCNSEGKCQCKPGVTGDKCDRCDVNHYDFSNTGCKNCGCEIAGSLDNQPNCDPYTGTCFCKANVEGQRCRECKLGFFNLDIENVFGCSPCFCYGHSSECTSAVGYSKYQVESTFAKNNERWTAVDEYNRRLDSRYESVSQSIGVQSLGDELAYFVAPERYLGDQRASYNQLITFSLRIGESRAIPTARDIILEGGGVEVSNTIFAQSNPIPNIQVQEYKFRLHEHPDYGWQPRLSSTGFMSLLTNLTAIKIKGTYAPQGVGFLDDVKLETASRGVAGKPAKWIETCNCRTGYVGQFCESCAPGYRHHPSQGSFMPCVPCDCNKHADICDYETGRCICHHNTMGENCELCARGYYGNALGGTPDDCLPCGCPNGGACIQVDEETIMCTECPLGYSGARCESCSDGYYRSEDNSCVPCECNNHIDTNGIGNCNTTTGECLRCIHNTAGFHCDKCLPGHYGNPILPEGCKMCECYHLGTQANDEGSPDCDQTTGSCYCKPHVVGKNCDKCEDGYYNLQSGEGCQPCNCDSIGSHNYTCDSYTGQCYCRPGVTGLRCDHCETLKYGFSTEGCKECDCDRIGSKDLQCDASGQCPCLENVEGRRCDRCKENKYARQKGCIDCPDCYNLVQFATHSHNNKLQRLNEILDEIERKPTVIADDKFPEELDKLQDEIETFYHKVKNATGDDSIVQQVHDIREREKDISRTLNEIDENIYLTNDKAQKTKATMNEAEKLLEEADAKLTDVLKHFESEARQVLEDAKNRSKTVGQQSEKMTDIAHQARELADELDSRADQLILKTQETKNKSIEALEKARNATFNQQRVGDQARELKNELITVEQNLNNTQKLTKEVSERAKEVKKEALNLLSEVNNIFIPQMNIDELKMKVKQLENEAYKLSNMSDEVFKGNEMTLVDIREKLIQGRYLLSDAKDQEASTEQLLADLKLSQDQANKSVTLGNDIIKQAQDYYLLFQDFDAQTKKSKKEAEDALATIDQIVAIIEDTNRNIEEGEASLRDAKGGVGVALTNAQNAEELAKDASTTAFKIKKDAEMLHQNATNLGNEANLMFDRVRNTEGRLSTLLEITKSNDTLITEAKEKVGRAGKDTDEASKSVHELLNNVNAIISELESAPDLNEEEIDRFEIEIRQIEQQIRDAELEESLEKLRNKHKEQDELIDQYNKEIEKLERDVLNIEQITRSLPNGCFKKIKLEP